MSAHERRLLNRCVAALNDLCDAHGIYPGSCDCGECDGPCMNTRVLDAIELAGDYLNGIRKEEP